MADEAQVRASLQVIVGNTNYRSNPTTFNADVSTIGGPAPGTIKATTNGTEVDFTGGSGGGGVVDNPSLCVIRNLGPSDGTTGVDNIDVVDVGIYDTGTGKFFPLIELATGESYVVRLSRNLGEELGTGTGTGTSGPDTNTMMLKAQGSSELLVLVEAFNL
jgi:hypothetical protein